MELRKDPITRSWVMTGDDPGDRRCAPTPPARFCADRRDLSTGHRQVPKRTRSSVVGALRGASHAALPHRRRARTAVATAFTTACIPWARMKCWSKIRTTTAIFGTPATTRLPIFCASPPSASSTSSATRVSSTSACFKDYGKNAGQEFSHPTSQITATMFVPRRVLYELRAGREYFVSKERCVFCDIIHQEERQAQRVIEARGDYLALCPYAPRVPYETWILPRNHDASFERTGLNKPGLRTNLAALLRRTLQRIRTVTEDFHLVLHTSPSSIHPSKISATGRPLTRTITGTSKSSRSWVPRRAPIRSKRSTIRPSARKLR